MTITFVKTIRTQTAVKIANENQGNVRNLCPSHSTLDALMAILEIDVLTMTECRIGREWGLSFPESETAGIHYNLEGSGQMFVGAGPAIPLTPHTLVITPPRQPFRIDAGTRQLAPSRTGRLEA